MAGLSPRSPFFEDLGEGLEMCTSTDERQTAMAVNFEAFISTLSTEQALVEGLEMRTSTDERQTAMGVNIPAVVQRPLYTTALLSNEALVHQIRGIIDDIQRRHKPSRPLEVGHGSATTGGHYIPACTTVIIAEDNFNGHEVGDGPVVAAGGRRSHSHLMDPPQHVRQFTPLEVCDGVATPSVHSEPGAIVNDIYVVGDGDAAAGGVRGRNGGAGVSRLSDGGGDANNPFWMWLRREFSSTWRLLGTGDINVLKAGSFALGLIPFFVDKQPPLNAQDAIYLRTAFWCGVSAFVIAPWRVPGAESTRLARNRQGIAVTFLITGALICMVTAVDEKFRLWVLPLSIGILLFALWLDRRESNDNHLLPLYARGGRPDV